MGFEFPATSQSRVEWWGAPQYTRRGMLFFTIVFGAFGLHHFYLRSPQTGILFLIFNVLSLGFWYFFDIVQLMTRDNEELNAYGLDIPWWGPAGIAQGMWKCKGTPEVAANAGPPSPLWFLAYMITLPILPLSRAIAGDIQNSFIAVLNLTVLPFGWLNNILQFFYDLMNITVFPGDVFYGGLKRAFPFTLMGWDKDGHSSNITGIRELGNLCGEKDNVFVRLMRVLLEAFLALMPAPLFAGLRAALAKGKEAVDNTVQEVKEYRDNFVEKVTENAVHAKDKVLEGAVIAKDKALEVVQQVEPYVEPALDVAKGTAKVLGGVAVEAAIVAGEAAYKTGKAVATEVVDTATTAYKVGTTVGKLAVDVPVAVTKGLASAGTKIAEAQAEALRQKARATASAFTDPAEALRQRALSTASNFQQKASNLSKATSPLTSPLNSASKLASLQTGGGSEMNLSDTLAIGGIVALLGGALFLNVGRSFLDAVHSTSGPNDLPPS